MAGELAPIDQAHQALRFTPQERALYERHLANLTGPGKVEHPDGSVSTLYQMNVQGPDGLHYNIPSVYNGKILQPQQAIQQAAQQGWHNFPSYATPEAAEARYQQMHPYFDQDVTGFLAQRKQGQFSGR